MGLAGQRILLVEDEYLVGEDLRYIIEQAGFQVIGPFDTSEAALGAMDSGTLDGAVLDVRLHDNSTSVAVARELLLRGLPFLVLTAYERQIVPPEMRKAPYLAKPYLRASLVDMVSCVFTPMASYQPWDRRIT